MTVAVTGAASPLGEAVTAALVAADGIGRVVAIDDRRGRAEGVTWRLGDVTSPDVAEQLRGANAVVHLAAPVDLAAALQDSQRRERAVRAVQAVVTASAAVGARRLVAVTSAMVLGAAPDNPVPLGDDAPVGGRPRLGHRRRPARGRARARAGPARASGAGRHACSGRPRSWVRASTR